MLSQSKEVLSFDLSSPNISSTFYLLALVSAKVFIVFILFCFVLNW